MRIAFLTTDNRNQFEEYTNPDPHFGPAPAVVLEALGRIPSLEVHVVSCTRHPMKSPEKLGERIWFHSLHVPKIGWMRPLYLGCSRATRRKLVQIRPDIVHGQGTELDCSISAVRSGFPNVVTLHGNMKEMSQVLKARVGSFYWLADRLESHCFRRTAGVFCNSAHTERLVAPRARKVWRVPNALRPDVFNQPPSSPPTGKPVLLNVGTIYSNKRQLELLRLLQEIKHEGAEFELWFVGGSNPADSYAQFFLREAEKAECEGWVRVLGHLAVDQLISVYDRASALVHVPESESFGLVVAEALARNARVFGFGVGGVSDIAEGVEGAELCTDGDWSGLKAGLLAWLKAGQPRAIGAAEIMRDRYHPDRIVSRHLEIYREVLNMPAT